MVASRSRRNGILLALATSLVLVGCADASPGEGSGEGTILGTLSGEDREFVEALIEEAQAEGQLFLNWQRYNDIIGDLETGFERMYGLDIDLVHTPNPDGSAAQGQVVDEWRAGRDSHSDIVEGLNTRINNLLRSGAVPEFDYARLPHITEEMVEAENRAVVYSHVMPGISYNTNTVDAADVPRTAQDVIDNNLLEKYAAAATATASLVDSLYTEVVDQSIWGWDRACEYNRQLGQGVAGLINSGEVARVASGEFDMLIFDTGQDTPQLIKEGAPLGLALLSDALFLRPGYLSIPENAPNPATARLFVDYIVSPEAQALIYDAYVIDSHFVEGSRTLPEFQELVAGGAEPALLDIAVLSTLSEEEDAHLSELTRQLIRGEQASCERSAS